MTKARVVSLEKLGAPNVIQILDKDLPPPGKGEVQLRQTAIGFNFIDIYQRSGFYPLELPTGLGHEAVGVVEALGEGVTGLKVGDRVMYMNAGIGAYASARNVLAEKLVPVPSNISDEVAAAVFFKAMTAQYLVQKTYKVKAGDIVVVHAAAGGVGQILAGWAKALGAFVVGTVGSSGKIAAAKQAGCDVVVDYSQPNWVEEVIKATGGKKANVVYDSVAKDTFLGSLECTAPFGTVALFGAASGPAPEIQPEILNKKGCLFLTRPSVFPHNATHALLQENAKAVFDAIAKGYVKVQIGAKFPLEQAQEAHRAAEERKVSGAIVLIP
ncbi:MAG: quinone oxidoreductase [Polynucleobacter sp.]|uniref:quinone oxidoreductase family protein n=1 Tax=Polynucleobacter sp. TaxID=2029855 RepID=UPI0021736B6D|nr:quinone oxidoreductase [Polynucleobacter sp.]MBU3670040.1 quinone oxidoreductase [Polynucleobacter sp.]MCW1966151.1 quinone oxidoreductase [Polynucleobacter sp.]